MPSQKEMEGFDSYFPSHFDLLRHAVENWQALSPEEGALLSLKELLSIDGDQAIFFSEYNASPYLQEICLEVSEWAKEIGIWLEGARIYITMGPELNALATRDRLRVICKMYTFLFFVDDTIGNEKLALLNSGEQRQVMTVMGALLKAFYQGKYLELPAQLLGSSALDMTLDSVVRAFNNITEELSALIAKDAMTQPQAAVWYANFRADLVGHLEQGVKNHNDSYTSQAVDVGTYIQTRRKVSGMELSVKFMELGSANYLDFAFLEAQVFPTRFIEYLGKPVELNNLADVMKLLQTCCIDYGGLSNDLFSMVKESIHDRTPFNLIAVVFAQLLLEQPNLESIENYQLHQVLYETILSSCELVRDIVTTFQAAQDLLYSQLHALQPISVDDTDLQHPKWIEPSLPRILKHVRDLRMAVQASWFWQLGNGLKRYQEELSVFEETKLK